MEYHELKLMLDSPPVRLLRAQNAPLLLAFLHRVFKQEHRVAVPEGQLRAALEAELEEPRLVQRHPLSYMATLLAVCLREEFLRFDAAPGDSTRLVLSRDELRNFIMDFLRDSTNEVRDVARLDRAIQQLVDLGFLRPLGSADENRFEVMRIVKARLGPAELGEIKLRLLNHAQSGA